MKRVLVTGAAGFIGKNLCQTLKELSEVELYQFDLDNDPQDLRKYLDLADIVVHLAGINRPKDASEFDVGNRGSIQELLATLKAIGRKIPVILSSSIQAELDNPYGKSKRLAEEALLGWSREEDVPVYVFRLPNVFGKWCRPNYNSVVATFCHNSANRLPIEIHDPAKLLSLVYVDQVVKAFASVIEGKSLFKAGYCQIHKTHVITLGELAEKIVAFNTSRSDLVMPSLSSDLDRALYATFVSYLPKGSFSYPLQMRHDNRGWLAEFIKSSEFGQIFVSRTKPGITRGNHWHHSKVEKFLVVEGTALIKFRHIISGEIVSCRVSGEKLTVVDIPTGYTHSITNVGETDLITLFWADEIFDQNNPDTFFLEA